MTNPTPVRSIPDMDIPVKQSSIRTFRSRSLIAADDVSPDTIIEGVDAVIRGIERHAEEAEVALDWNSLVLETDGAHHEVVALNGFRITRHLGPQVIEARVSTFDES